MAELIKPGYDDIADIADINSNTDEFAARIANCKTKQTVKADPSADGTAVSFIASVTQNANGEVTATKKTVRNMTGATASVAGATGLVPQPGTGDVGKFLKGDGTWGTPANTTYSEATSSAYGLVKIGYTASGKNYPVQLSSGKMYVNVPWTDNNTTYSQATSSALGLVKIGYTASGKNYPVQLDSSGKMYVNVPWTDNNTTYSEATSSAYGLIKIGYTANGKNYPVQLSSGKAFVNVPWTDNNTTYSEATSSTYGLIKIGYTASGKNYPVQLSGGKAYVNVPWTDTNTTYSNFGGATASKAGSAGLVPGPGAGKQYSVLYGEGGWASMQDLLNVTGAVAYNKVNGTGYRIQFKWGTVSNVSAINTQSSKLFDNAFDNNCFCVFTQVASTHNGVYARVRTYGWDKNGFGYQAQTGDSSNISFYYLAIGY